VEVHGRSVVLNRPMVARDGKLVMRTAMVATAYNNGERRQSPASRRGTCPGEGRCWWAFYRWLHARLKANGGEGGLAVAEHTRGGRAGGLHNGVRRGGARARRVTKAQALRHALGACC
jgi:hypothetical protein